MAQNTETLLLQVDIQANNTRLVELQKQLNENKNALTALNKSFKENRISADELAVGQVKLKQEASNLAQEQRALNKANSDQIKILEEEEGSINQLRAQLAQGTAAYNALSKAKRDDTEEGQKLQANNKMLSDNLKILEAAIGDTRRNVGNYAQAIDPLIAQLVKLEEAQKLAAPDSEEYARAIPVIKGFQQQITDTAIKAGVSQEELNNKFEQTAAAIRPATAALVKLEEEQKNVAKGTEAYTQIGFKIGQASKAIDHAADSLKKGAPESKKLSTGLLEAARSSDLFGGAVDKASSVQEKFVKAQELAKLATGGWTGALGLLRVALIATGLGALAIVLGSVVTYLTQTAEGSRLLTTVMDQVGAVVNVVVDRFGAFGKAVTQVLSGDFKGAAATAKGAMSGFGDEIQREVKLSGDLSKARQQLDIDTAKNIATNKRLLNEVERLKNVRDNEFNTIQQRQKANEDAYKIELTREKTLADLARRRIAVIQTEIDLRGGITKASLEQRKALGEAENELSDIQEDAAGKQNELITNRFQLNKELLEQQQKLREDAIKGRIAQINTELTTVKVGSQRELELREQLIRETASLELAGAEKTANDKKLILAKSIQDQLKLDEDFEKSRSERAKTFLAEQLARDQASVAAAQKQRDDKKKAEEEAYAQNERLIERNLARQAQEIEKSYSEGLINKAQYDSRIELLEENALGARLILQKQYNKDTTALESQLLKLQNARRQKVTDEEKKVYAERIENARAFGSEVGALFAETLTSTGATLQEFAGKVLILILDQLQKQVLAQQAAATAASLAQPDSIASFGASGLVRAGIINGLIVAAFETAKALISQGTQAFNSGGIVGGSLSPGSQNKDTELTYLTKGEIVMNKAASQELAPVLSYLNSMYGGANFAPGFTPALAPRQIDGGLMSRMIGAGATIDYQQLASALKGVNLNVAVRTIDKAKAAYDKPRALTSLR
jgi:hypothetical protein